MTVIPGNWRLKKTTFRLMRRLTSTSLNKSKDLLWQGCLQKLSVLIQVYLWLHYTLISAVFKLGFYMPVYTCRAQDTCQFPWDTFRDTFGKPGQVNLCTSRFWKKQADLYMCAENRSFLKSSSAVHRNDITGWHHSLQAWQQLKQTFKTKPQSLLRNGSIYSS